MEQAQGLIEAGKKQLYRQLQQEIEAYCLLSSQIKRSKNKIEKLKLTISEVQGKPFAIKGKFAIYWLIEKGVNTLRELGEITGFGNNSLSNILLLDEGKGNIERVLPPGQERGAEYILTELARSNYRVDVQAPIPFVPPDENQPKVRVRIVLTKSAGNMTKAHLDASNKECPGNNSEYPLAS